MALTTDIPAIELAAALPFIALLSYLAVTDARHLRLPVTANLGLTLTGLASGGLAFETPFGDRIAGWLAGMLTLQALAWIYRQVRKREGIGGGDPILLGGIGAWLGWQPLPVIVLVAALMGLALALLLHLLSRHHADWSALRLPLGSLLATAALLVAVSGQGSPANQEPVGMPDGPLPQAAHAQLPPGPQLAAHIGQVAGRAGKVDRSYAPQGRSRHSSEAALPG